MPKKLLALIIVFLFVSAGFLFVTLTYSKNSPLQNFSLKTPSPRPVPESTLIFSPNPLTVTIGATGSANIILDVQGTFPKILQLEIAYDPTILTQMKILPGDISDTQRILLNKINYNTGRISYAIDTPVKQISQKKSQIVATIHFLPINTLGKHETYINFLPKTTIKGENNVNTFTAGYGLRIILH